VAEWIKLRVVELIYTAWDMQPFAKDCGFEGNPFVWDEERRQQLRCELDAAVFHLYGVNQEEAAFILDSFPLVRKADEAKYGAYRTKEIILGLFSAYASPGAMAPRTDLSRMSMVVVLLLQAAKQAAKTICRDDLTLGLALFFNDAARKAVLGQALSDGEKRQLDDLPEYVVGLNDLLARQSAQGLIREHEGLYLPGLKSPAFNQAPPADWTLIQEIVQAVFAMKPSEKKNWTAKLYAKNPVP
jgi:hypothetical protein